MSEIIKSEGEIGSFNPQAAEEEKIQFDEEVIEAPKFDKASLKEFNHHKKRLYPVPCAWCLRKGRKRTVNLSESDKTDGICFSCAKDGFSTSEARDQFVKDFRQDYVRLKIILDKQVEEDSKKEYSFLVNKDKLQELKSLAEEKNYDYRILLASLALEYAAYEPNAGIVAEAIRRLKLVS